MKKKMMAGLLAAVLLAGCVTAAWAGSGPDPLISLSYLNGAYLTDLKAYITQWVTQDTQGIYNDAVAQAGRHKPSGDGWTTSSGFATGSGKSGDAVILSAGSGLIWTSGSGYVTSGVLVDATAGAELALGAALISGHRYLAAEQAEVSITSQSVQWLAEGRWKMGTGQAPLPFTDVAPGQWYYEDVRFAVENGLFQGVGGGRFNPGGTMERGMMTTVLHRLAGSPGTIAQVSFTDVPAGSWYAQAVVWGAAQGITSGKGGGLFDPDGLVTREQAVAMMYNYAVTYMGLSAGTGADLSGYADLSRLSSWARPAMAWAVEQGVISGVTNGSALTLEPQRSATRAEMATMLRAFCENIL